MEGLPIDYFIQEYAALHSFKTSYIYQLQVMFMQSFLFIFISSCLAL